MSVNLYVDLETLQLIQGPGQRNAFASLRFKRGDAAILRVVFLENGITPVTIGNPSGLEIQIGIKPRNQFDHAYLAQSTNWTMPVAGDETPTYECTLSLNTLQLNAALNIGSPTAEELPEITLMGEITWREGNEEPTSTRTFIVVVENDVNRGTEGIPNDATPPFPPELALKSDLGTAAAANTGITEGNIPLLGSGGKLALSLLPDIGAAAPAATAATPNTLVLRNSNGGGVSFTESSPFINTLNVTHTGYGGDNFFALTVSSNHGTGARISSTNGIGAHITSAFGSGAHISSETGVGAVIQAGPSFGNGANISAAAGNGAQITSVSGIGARISSTTGTHLNVGDGKILVANNGNTTFTGTVTASNLVTNNGANSFAVRPSSSGPVLAPASLITQADGYYQHILNPLKSGVVDVRPLAPYFIKSSGAAGYTLTMSFHATEVTTPTTGTPLDSFFSYRLSDSIFTELGTRWNYTRGCELFALCERFLSNPVGTRYQIAICKNAPSGRMETDDNFGLAIELITYPGGEVDIRLKRKCFGGVIPVGVTPSFLLPATEKYFAMWLKITADGAVELRVVSAPVAGFTSFPARPAIAQRTLPAAVYDQAAGSIFLTGRATHATATENGGTIKFFKLNYHIDN